MALLLFVDDEPDTLSTFKKAVEMFGHHAVLANSGQEALRLASEILPELIFVDMMLTDMNGLDVVRNLHENERTASIPVIVISAEPGPDVAERAQAVGARDYLLKPVRLQILLDMIDESISANPRHPGQ